MQLQGFRLGIEPTTLDLPRFQLLNKLIYTCKEQHYGAIFDRAMTENIFS